MTPKRTQTLNTTWHGPESEQLDRLEAIAQHGLETYVEVGDALAQIRDRRRYRVSHPSFETYIRERWGVNIVRQDAGAAPAAAQTAPDLLPMLRWRLSQAIGTIAEVAHLLEARASDVDERARKHLREDVLSSTTSLEPSRRCSPHPSIGIRSSGSCSAASSRRSTQTRIGATTNDSDPHGSTPPLRRRASSPGIRYFSRAFQ